MIHRRMIVRTVAAARWVAVAAVVTLAGVGCSSPTSDLRVMSLKGPRKTYSQPFAEAYARRNGEGSLDVVLTRDSGTADAAGRTTGSARSLRQVMHVRVLWQPMRDTKRTTPPRPTPPSTGTSCPTPVGRRR